MKRYLVLMLAITLTGAASTARAAGGEWMGGLQGGVHVPSSDYGDFAKAGWVGGASLDYGMNDMFSMGAQVDYNATKAKNDIITSLNLVGITGAEINTTIFNYGVHGNLYLLPAGAVRPYLMATVGAYNVKTETKGGNLFTSTNTDTKFGFGGGVGLTLRPVGSPIGFGVEGVIHDVPDATNQFNLESPYFGAKSALMYYNVVAKVTFSFSDMGQTGTGTGGGTQRY